MPKSRGFTLIELLVVVSIIALLSSVVMSSLNSARAKARDARRLQDVSALRTALNLFASDNAGSYPAYSTSCIGVTTGSQCWTGYNHNGGGSGLSGNTAFNTALTPYLRSIPRDPETSRSVGDSYVYFQGTADIHCNGVDSVPNGVWVAWQPDTVNPTADSACKMGGAKYACCSGIGCGSHNFCVLKVN